MEFKKTLCSAILVASTLMAASAQAFTSTFTITPNNNLYWSGMNARNSSFSGNYMGYGIQPDGAPALGSRNKLGDYLDASDPAACPQCFYTTNELWGLRPVVAQLEPGTTVIDAITIGGIIDHDGANDWDGDGDLDGFPWNMPGETSNPYNLAPRGPRGHGSTLQENGFANYSLIGLWVADLDPDFFSPGFTPAEGEGNLGFTPIGEEFHFTTALGDTSNSDDPFTKTDWTVPTGAEALLMAFNGHRGGFAHRDENGNYFATGSFTVTLSNVVTPVPIPATIWLFGSALLGLIGYRQRLAG